MLNLGCGVGVGAGVFAEFEFEGRGGGGDGGGEDIFFGEGLDGWFWHRGFGILHFDFGF